MPRRLNHCRETWARRRYLQLELTVVTLPGGVDQDGLGVLGADHGEARRAPTPGRWVEPAPSGHSEKLTGDPHLVGARPQRRTAVQPGRVDHGAALDDHLVPAVYQVLQARLELGFRPPPDVPVEVMDDHLAEGVGERVPALHLLRAGDALGELRVEEEATVPVDERQRFAIRATQAEGGRHNQLTVRPAALIEADLALESTDPGCELTQPSSRPSSSSVARSFWTAGIPARTVGGKHSRATARQCSKAS